VDQIREEKDRYKNRYYRESLREQKLEANEPSNYNFQEKKTGNVKR
jgi:hypothetical protein